jgi:sulfite reductase alpha subunit
MHCINVMTYALKPGRERGVTILLGGKRTLKIGDLMGTVIVPFMRLESDEDFERLRELAEEIIEFWAENALEHERVGETIERIGLTDFLEGVGLDIDLNMIAQPRTNPFVRTDGWDEEAAKWWDRHGGQPSTARSAAE